MRYAVVGATSWGVTLARLLANANHGVTLVVRTESEAAEVRRRRGIARLPEVTLGPDIDVAPQQAAATQFDGAVFAVPAQSLRSCLEALPVGRSTPALSAAKGIEHGTGMRMSEVLTSAGWQPGDVSVLSGPNLAHEVARGLPAAAVVASSSEEAATHWQVALSGSAFRCYRSRDVVGVEIAGALKNVIAIAAGAVAGLEFGANAIAAIMTRGLAEMTRLGMALGAEPMTFQGLAGIGDLAATCYSPLSRNRRLGEMLARGFSARDAIAEIGEAVEGAATAPVAVELAARVGVEVPIAVEVARVVEGRATVADAMAALLSRDLRSEVEPQAR